MFEMLLNDNKKKITIQQFLFLKINPNLQEVRYLMPDQFPLINSDKINFLF